MAQPDCYVPNPPSDTVSSISWAPRHEAFVSTSWAMDLRAYMVSTSGRGAPQVQHRLALKHTAPILTSAWNGDGTAVAIGGADNKVGIWSVKGSQKIEVIGQHTGPVCGVKWSSSLNMFISVSWDKTVKYWDLRKKNAAGTLHINGKPYCLDIHDEKLVIGSSVSHDEQEIALVHLKTPGKVAKYDPTPLKRYIKSLAIFPDGLAYVATGLEGRVAVTSFKPEHKSKDFAFKCHRRGPEENEVFPIHGLSPSPSVDGSFATCGGEGTVAFWDRHSKSKWKNPIGKSGGTPVTAVSFNRNGSLLAYARGYDWQRGIHGADARHQVQILVRHFK